MTKLQRIWKLKFGKKNILLLLTIMYVYDIKLQWVMIKEQAVTTNNLFIKKSYNEKWIFLQSKMYIYSIRLFEHKMTKILSPLCNCRSCLNWKVKLTFNQSREERSGMVLEVYRKVVSIEKFNLQCKKWSVVQCGDENPLMCIIRV